MSSIKSTSNNNKPSKRERGKRLRPDNDRRKKTVEDKKRRTVEDRRKKIEEDKRKRTGGGKQMIREKLLRPSREKSKRLLPRKLRLRLQPKKLLSKDRLPQHLPQLVQHQLVALLHRESLQVLVDLLTARLVMWLETLF